MKRYFAWINRKRELCIEVVKPGDRTPVLKVPVHEAVLLLTRHQEVQCGIRCADCGGVDAHSPSCRRAR